MSAPYPTVLKAAAMRLRNYSATVRKVLPMGPSSGYQAGSTVRFVLPANSLVDLRTLKMFFKGTTAADDDTGYVAFPSGIESVIDQIVVSANGVQIEATQPQYGALVKLLHDFTLGDDKRVARMALQNEHMQGMRSTGDFYRFAGIQQADIVTNAAGNDRKLGNIAVAAPTIKVGTRDVGEPFCIESWPGCFLGTVQPRVISTALTGDIHIEIRFAPNSILAALGLKGRVIPDAGAVPEDAMEVDEFIYNLETAQADEPAPPANPRYTLDDVYMTVKTIDIADGEFYSYLKAEIEAKPLDLPFEHWYMQPGVPSQADATTTTRMTVNSSSLNMLIGTFQGSDYANNGLHPGTAAEARIHAITPWGKAAFAAGQVGTFGNAQTTRYFQRGGISKTGFESTWAINNVQLNYPAGLPDIWANLKEEFGQLSGHAVPGTNSRLGGSLDNFAQAFFAVPLRLNFKADDDVSNPRYLSGLDSRASTVNVLWQTKGAKDPALTAAGVALVPQIWAGCTSILRISPGRQLDLVA